MLFQIFSGTLVNIQSDKNPETKLRDEIAIIKNIFRSKLKNNLRLLFVKIIFAINQINKTIEIIFNIPNGIFKKKKYLPILLIIPYFYEWGGLHTTLSTTTKNR